MFPQPIIADEAADTEGKTIFNIPEANYGRFEKEIASLSRRAEKLGCSPIKPFTFGYHMEESNGGARKVYEVYLTADTPMLEGWSFIARIDHSNETGNIIRTIPNATVAVPAVYRTSAPNCDHCNHRRQRRDTFIVHNDETGEFKQIGSTCLKDFLGGHDPIKMARLAELLGYAHEVGEAQTVVQEGAGLNDYRWINLEDYLGCVAAEIRENGWVSSKAAREEERTSTREAASWRRRTMESVTDADIALASSALDWARSLREKADLNDFEHNLLVVAEATYIEGRSMGLAAAIVGCYPERLRRPDSVEVGNMDGLLNLFRKAQASGLRYPKFHLRVDGSPVVLTIAGSQSKAPGTINVTDGGPYGANTWFGRVDRDGTWSPSRQTSPAKMTALTELLVRMSQKPAKTASEYGRLTGNCMFCLKPLKDERSTQAGYGGTCAKRLGLPWGQKAEAL